MKQMYEVIIRYEGEKPELPSTCQYLPYPQYTYQPPCTEKVHEGTDFKSAQSAFNTLKTIAAIVAVTLYHGGNRRKQWQRNPGWQ